MSDRSDKPFITINAAAFPENLLEAELFGYKKGSFTGATSDHMGFIEQANTGTLFIDEVGELSLNVQTKLLRVLQEKSVHRIGETKARDIEFRLVAATNKDLAAMVEAGSFREDLYYRIAGAVVSLPPLRQRREDILLLANYFKKEFSIKHHIPEKNWGSDAIEALEAHSWPGNIRELGNTVHRSIVMTEKNIICREDLGLVASPGKIKTANQFQIGLPKYDDLASAKRDFMRTFLLGSLNKFSGNRVKTAKALGIGQRTLFRYLEQYEIRD
jgi:transcriptional regulator with PAS, ATPase and Fis domain